MVWISAILFAVCMVLIAGFGVPNKLDALEQQSQIEMAAAQARIVLAHKGFPGAVITAMRHLGS